MSPVAIILKYIRVCVCRQLTDERVLKTACEDHQLCVIAVLPNILDCQSKCRNDYISLLRRLGDKHKKRQWGWEWWLVISRNNSDSSSLSLCVSLVILIDGDNVLCPTCGDVAAFSRPPRDVLTPCLRPQTAQSLCFLGSTVRHLGLVGRCLGILRSRDDLLTVEWDVKSLL